MDSEFLKVYDESGNPLGEVLQSALLPSEPTWDTKLRRRHHQNQVWLPDAREWRTLTAPPIPNSGLAYRYQEGEDNALFRPSLSFHHWVGHEGTCIEDFFTKLRFLVLDAPVTDDNVVGWQAGDSIKMTQMVAGGQALRAIPSVEPNSDRQAFWFVTPAYICLKPTRGCPAGRPCTFQEAATNLVENPTISNVREMFSAFSRIGPRVGIPEGTVQFYKIVKGTSRLIDKIAFFALDGWSHVVYKGDSYFVKGG